MDGLHSLQAEDAASKQAALSLAQLQRFQAVTTPAEMAGVDVPVLVLVGEEDYFNGASCRGPSGQSSPEVRAL